MIVKVLFIPSLLLVAGLILVAFAIFAPARTPQQSRPGPGERIRVLERLRASASAEELARALVDPQIEVAAVAAILLRDIGREDLIRASPRSGDLEVLLAFGGWRR